MHSRARQYAATDPTAPGGSGLGRATQLPYYGPGSNQYSGADPLRDIRAGYSPSHRSSAAPLGVSAALDSYGSGTQSQLRPVATMLPWTNSALDQYDALHGGAGGAGAP